MKNKADWIWFDGEFVKWQEATVHVLTHTLHYGVGVFEGIRAYEAANKTSIFRLDEHIQRLFDSAHILMMDIPFSAENLTSAVIAAVKNNNLTSAYIRPMCFYGDEDMGLRADNLKVHVIVAAWNWPTYMDASSAQLGIRVKTSSYTRHHVNTSMCKAKANGHYINSILALKEATKDGYDEALLLDHEGYVAEGSGENIFIVKDKVIYTPAATSCLKGITRDTVLSLANEAGYAVVEKSITRDEVYIADEAFFSGTAVEIVPIIELDRRTIGEGKRGEVTQDIQKRYFASVTGTANPNQHWLTRV